MCGRRSRLLLDDSEAEEAGGGFGQGEKDLDRDEFEAAGEGGGGFGGGKGAPVGEVFGGFDDVLEVVAEAAAEGENGSGAIVCKRKGGEEISLWMDRVEGEGVAEEIGDS